MNQSCDLYINSINLCSRNNLKIQGIINNSLCFSIKIKKTLGHYFNTDNSFPTLINAEIARSRCPRECAADSCTLILACPSGTTG